MFAKTLFAAALAVAVTSPAAAVDFSFTGTLDTPNSTAFFDFTVASQSLVTFRTWGYAGGVNAAGTTIAAGGFDAILTIFDAADGTLLAEQDDGLGVVAIDPATGSGFDAFATVLLNAGDYRLGVRVFPGFTNGSNVADGFTIANSFDGRTNAFPADLLNVNVAPGPAIPEPASWAMLIAGFGLTGAALRRRRISQATAAA